MHPFDVVWVKCCRRWPVVPLYAVRTCGLCGTVPVPCAEEEEEDERTTDQ